MAEFMRDRLVYKVFHSTEEDAVDLLMEQFAKSFPETEEDQLATIRETAEDAVATTRESAGWFAISPGGRIEVISPVDIAVGWEEFDGGSGDIFAEVLAEKERQVEKGYTPEHDDEHGGDHLIEVAESYLDTIPADATGADVRTRAIKSIATLVALVELVDRAERANIASLVEEAISEIPEAEV